MTFVEGLEAANTYPKEENIFKALELCALEDVCVVILGQDPYHGEGQAQGLAFSVPQGMKLPPSLRNIYKEMADDLNLESLPESGDLSHWASQGVLLLNTVLTVEPAKAHSHAKKGWENLTDTIIKTVSAKSSPVVFILWGAPAQKKVKLIDSKKHLILKSPHPSPLSSYRGFFGSKPFSKTNAFLKKKVKWY